MSNDGFVFTLTSKEADLILEAISELPFKKVADLFFKLQSQAREQLENRNIKLEPSEDQ